MDILLMVIWAVTAPIMLWSRWNGPVVLFNVVLIVNSLCGLYIIIRNWDFGK